jgi:peptide/nickel transport system ATP-binding protein
MSQLLDIINATKVFRLGGAIRGRKLTAVDQISLKLDDEKPSILSVVGESGCGKSTLCKMILRIHNIDEGDISLTGRSYAISDVLKSNLFTKSLFARLWKSVILFLIIGAFSLFLINYITPYTQYADVINEIHRIENLDQEIFTLEQQRDEMERQAELPGASLRLQQQINELGWYIGDLNRMYQDYLDNDGASVLNAINETAHTSQQDLVQDILTWSLLAGAAMLVSAFLYLVFVRKDFIELRKLGMPKHVAVLKSLAPIAIVGFLAMMAGSFVSWNNTYGQVSDTLRAMYDTDGSLYAAPNAERWLNRIITNSEESAMFTLTQRALLAAGKLVVLLIFTAIGSSIIAKQPEKRVDVYDFKSFRKDVQPIFQNPYETFSMRKRVDSYLFSTARRLGAARNRKEAEQVVDEVLRSVGLSLAVVRGKYTAQFSGGELQRISIARALIPRPKVIVADEPVAAIDASMKMNIVNLFKELKDKYNVSFIYITHDLSTAYYVSDYMATLYRGALIEYGPAKEVMDNPGHPYTELLMNAVPRVGDKWDESVVLPEMEEKEYSITFCKFAPRCPYATDECRKDRPKVVNISETRSVLCNYPLVKD